MAAKDCNYFKSNKYKIGKGEDKKGKYIKYRLETEQPCSCHPETCSHFDGKTWRTQEFKQYSDGSMVFKK